MTSCVDGGKRGVELAFDLAREDLSRADPQRLCAASGASFDPQRGILLPFLNRAYRISHPEGLVYREDGQEEQQRVSVLLLHYLLRERPLATMGSDVDFRSLPGGMSYIGPYTQRTISRLTREFGSDPMLLTTAAAALRATPLADSGDVAFQIEALPSISVKVVFWKGDDEFPASATILYDASVTERLSTEDVVVLAETLVGELIQRARELRKERAGV
jgi:hypothetical protein